MNIVNVVDLLQLTLEHGGQLVVDGCNDVEVAVVLSAEEGGFVEHA